MIAYWWLDLRLKMSFKPSWASNLEFLNYYHEQAILVSFQLASTANTHIYLQFVSTTSRIQPNQAWKSSESSWECASACFCPSNLIFSSQHHIFIFSASAHMPFHFFYKLSLKLWENFQDDIWYRWMTKLPSSLYLLFLDSLTLVIVQSLLEMID